MRIFPSRGNVADPDGPLAAAESNNDWWAASKQPSGRIRKQRMASRNVNVNPISASVAPS